MRGGTGGGVRETEDEQTVQACDGISRDNASKMGFEKIMWVPLGTYHEMQRKDSSGSWNMRSNQTCIVE